MFRPFRLANGTALGALAALAACSSHDAPTVPGAGTPKPLDVAALAAEMRLPALPSASGFDAPVAIAVPSGCSYTAAAQSFVCPTVSSNGLTIALSYTLLDASGQSLAAADAGRVAAIRLVSATTGTTTLSAIGGVSGQLTVDDRQDMTLSGLLGTTHTLNGTSTSRLTGSVSIPGGPSRTLAPSSTTTVAGVVLPAVGSTTRWPLAGTVTTDLIDLSVGGAGKLTLRQAMTFNGTSRVTVVVSSNGIRVVACTIDLASPAVGLACG